MVRWPDVDFNLTFITRTELNRRGSDKHVGLPDSEREKGLGRTLALASSAIVVSVFKAEKSGKYARVLAER